MLQVAFQGGGDGDRVGDMAVFHGFLPLVTPLAGAGDSVLARNALQRDQRARSVL